MHYYVVELIEAARLTRIISGPYSTHKNASIDQGVWSRVRPRNRDNYRITYKVGHVVGEDNFPESVDLELVD